MTIIDPIRVIALLLSVVWISVNVHSLYPIVRSLIDRSLGISTPATFVKSINGGALRAFPTIDVLVPAYDEGDVIQQSIASIREAKYPQSRLNLYILVEPDDRKTRSALEALTDTYSFTETVVPTSYPGTPNKPRALNYGFEHTEGDIVGVIDAESVVSADLFQKIAVAIAREGCDFAQGLVDMTNEGDGWINTLFRAEYGYWYAVVVPAFHRVDYPIPLSGTTCFFRRPILEKLSEKGSKRYMDLWDRAARKRFFENGLNGNVPWDPSNVTEDFELGLHLWEQGYSFGLVDSVTTEESPLTIGRWTKQRTRWQKGKVYTMLRYLRAPFPDIVARCHLLWQSALPHLGPINVASVLILVVVANIVGYEPRGVVTGFLSVSLVFAGVAIAINTYGYWVASDTVAHVRIGRSIVIGTTLPLYWLLQWIADARALKQVYLGQLGWEKTLHVGKNAQSGETIASDGGMVAERINYRARIREALSRVRWLVPVLAAGLLGRLYHLGERSIWTDEAYSITVRGSLGLSQIFGLANDPHPPLYYVLLHGWMSLFGDSVTATRTLSVLVGIGAVIAIYPLGRTLFDHRTGLLASVLLSASAFQLHASRTVRMYGLVTLLTIVSLYFFVRVCRERSPGTTFAYALSTAMLLYTHIFAALVVLAQNIYVLTRLATTEKGDADLPSPTRWLWLQAVIGVAYAPWLLSSLARIISIASGAGGRGTEWIDVPGPATLIDTALAYVGYPIYYPILAGGRPAKTIASVLLVVSGAAVLSALVRRRPDSRRLELDRKNTDRLYLLVLVVGASVGILYAFSYLITPVYVIRYTIAGSVAFVLLVAKGIADLPDRRLRVFFVCVFVIGSAILSGAYLATDSEENWQDATALIEGTGTADDLLIFQPYWTRQPVGYYLDQPGMTTAEFPREPPDGSADLPAVGNVTRDSEAFDRVWDRVKSHEEVWVVNYGDGDPGPVVTTLQESASLVRHERYGVVEVYFFKRVDTSSHVSTSSTSHDSVAERTTSVIDSTTSVSNGAKQGKQSK